MKLFWKLDLIGLATALALPAAAYWTQVAPAIQRNLAAAAAIQQLEQQRNTQGQLQRSLTTLNTALDAGSAATRPALTLRPLGDLNLRLAELNDLAAKHGLSIDTLEPAAPVSHDRYSLTMINLAASGDYPSCQEWMNELGTALPDISIAQWQLSGVTADKNPQLKLTASLRWYAQPKAGSR